MVPPFKTYNLARSYEAAMSFSFQCSKKKYKAKFSWPLDIVCNERYIPPSQLLASNDDSDNVKKVGKMVFKGLITLVTTAVGG